MEESEELKKLKARIEELEKTSNPDIEELAQRVKTLEMVSNIGGDPELTKDLVDRKTQHYFSRLMGRNTLWATPFLLAAGYLGWNLSADALKTRDAIEFINKWWDEERRSLMMRLIVFSALDVHDVEVAVLHTRDCSDCESVFDLSYLDKIWDVEESTYDFVELHSSRSGIRRIWDLELPIVNVNIPCEELGQFSIFVRVNGIVLVSEERAKLRLHTSSAGRQESFELVCFPREPIPELFAIVPDVDYSELTETYIRDQSEIDLARELEKSIGLSGN